MKGLLEPARNPREADRAEFFQLAFDLGEVPSELADRLTVTEFVEIMAYRRAVSIARKVLEDRAQKERAPRGRR